MDTLNDEARRIARLLKRQKANATIFKLRDTLYEVVRKAIAENDVETLGLVALWFVVVSDDITIERCGMWTKEGGQIHSDKAAPE